MRNRILTMLIAISLLIAAPMLAQSGDEPVPQEDQKIEHSAELQAETDSQNASATAELSASTSDQEQDMNQEGDVDATATAEVSADSDRELPQTAGFLPLLALLGLGSLASALGLRALRK